MKKFKSLFSLYLSIGVLVFLISNLSLAQENESKEAKKEAKEETKKETKNEEKEVIKEITLEKLPVSVKKAVEQLTKEGELKGLWIIKKGKDVKYKVKREESAYTLINIVSQTGEVLSEENQGEQETLDRIKKEAERPLNEAKALAAKLLNIKEPFEVKFEIVNKVLIFIIKGKDKNLEGTAKISDVGEVRELIKDIDKTKVPENISKILKEKYPNAAIKNIKERKIFTTDPKKPDLKYVIILKEKEKEKEQTIEVAPPVKEEIKGSGIGAGEFTRIPDNLIK